MRVTISIIAIASAQAWVYVASFQLIIRRIADFTDAGAATGWRRAGYRRPPRRMGCRGQFAGQVRHGSMPRRRKVTATAPQL
jgi:hypothetical protein